MADDALAERLRRTVFEGAGTEIARPTVRIRCAEGGYLGPAQLDHLVALLGAGDDDRLVVGWFAGGVARECAELLGPPETRITLKPGWDVDWDIWRLAPDEARRVANELRSGPNLMFSEREGWLVALSPSSREAHLTADPVPVTASLGR